MYIGEWVSYLTDGVAVTTVEGTTVTTTINGPCAELRTPVENAMNGLLEQMANEFGFAFRLVSLTCGTTVVPAPSPPPPSPLSPYVSPYVFNAAAFTNSMSITALVQLDGVQMSSGTLMALVGTETRGVEGTPSVPPFGPYTAVALYQMFIYAEQDGETVHFQFHKGGAVTSLSLTLTFSINGLSGSVVTPLLLTGASPPPPTLPVPSPPPPRAPRPVAPSPSNPLPSPAPVSPPPLPPALPPMPPPVRPPPMTTEMTAELGVGWTWLSLYVEASDMSVNNVFAAVSSTMATGDHVKSQFSFTQYYEGFGFFGTLSTLTTDSMYAVSITNPTTFRFSGLPVALPKTISITTGWTFLPNPYGTTTSLAQAVPTGIAYMLNDQCKSQFSFSSYYPGYGWFGSLASFTPGWGYMLLLTGAGGEATFQPARRA
jgi:hypothetical protein